jgi:ABC-type uncharacterized transport system permease subunit
MFRLERRATPSSVMSFVSPLVAAVGMLATGFLLFSALGKDPVEAFYLFFIKPLSTSYGIGELLLKSTPLLLCGLGLALTSGTSAPRGNSPWERSPAAASRCGSATAIRAGRCP